MKKQPKGRQFAEGKGARGAYKEDKKDVFLAEFEKNPFLIRACKAARIDRKTVYDWLNHDEKFAEKFREIDESVTELCEASALQRGVKGVRKIILYQGRPVMNPGTKQPMYETVYSDHLLAKILEARSERFKPRLKHEFDPAPVQEAMMGVITLIRSKLPNCCPHCKTVLGIGPMLAAELMEMSKKFNLTPQGNG